MNFKIVRDGEFFRIKPITPMGESLCDHCYFHGDPLLYGTLGKAVAVMAGMEKTLKHRRGHPWMRVRKEAIRL